MTTLTLRPLRPALSLPPQLCQNRTAPTKLSLLIPSCAEETKLSIPSPSCRMTGTPIAGKKPKLSLSFGEDTCRTFTTSGSFSSSRLSVCTSASPSDDESNTSQEDITSRNTIVNTHIGSSAGELEGTFRWTRTYSFTAVSGKRSILKGSPSCNSNTLKRGVSFQEGHTVIPFPASSYEAEYEFIPRNPILDDIENMSPPSTTSSTDSEESESDSEPKTPIDNDDDDSRGRSFDRWAASGATRSGKWRRPKREWVWTLGGSDNNDIMQELEYSSASLMQVEAI